MTRRAFSLVLAVVLTGLIGTTIALMARGLTASIALGRLDELEIRAGQLLAAGQDWARLHPDARRAIVPESPRALPVADLLPVNAKGNVLIERSPEDDVLHVTVRVQDGSRSARRTVPFQPPSNSERAPT